MRLKGKENVSYALFLEIISYLINKTPPPLRALK